MRENRPSGSEGGETEPNRSSLPLFKTAGSAPDDTRRVLKSSGKPPHSKARSVTINCLRV